MKISLRRSLLGWGLGVSFTVLMGCGPVALWWTDSRSADSPEETNETEALLARFDQSRVARLWRSHGDRKMGGGFSEGVLVFLPDSKVARFEGTVSLSGGGGFASIRSPRAKRDLSAFDGFELRVRGDGGIYRFAFHMDSITNGVMYEAPFRTTADQWITVRLPWTMFKPTRQGRPVRQGGTFDSSKIESFSFLTGNYEAGPFRLDIDAIRMYLEP